jgi:hypothetical protein
MLSSMLERFFSLGEEVALSNLSEQAPHCAFSAACGCRVFPDSEPSFSAVSMATASLSARH